MIISFIGRGLGKGGCFSQDPQTSQPLEDGVPAAFPLFSAAFLAKAGAVLRSRGQKTPSGGVPTLYQLMSGLNWKMLPPKAGDFEDLRDFQEFLLAWNNSQKGTDEEGRPLWTSHFCHRGPNPQMPTLHSPCTLVSLPHAVQVPGGSKSPNFQNNVREQAHTPFLPGYLATNTSRKAKNVSATWGTGCSGQGGAWASPGCCTGVQQGVEVNLPGRLQVGLQGGIDAESLPVEIQQTVLVLGRAGLVIVSCWECPDNQLHALGLSLPFFNPFCLWQSGRNEPGRQASLLLPASIPGVRVPTHICSQTYSLTAPYSCALFPTASDGTVMAISYPWEGRSALNSPSPGTWCLGTAQI